MPVHHQQSTDDPIIIRTLADLSEMRAAEKLQQEVWGIDDLETVHSAEMIAVREAGGTVIGAFARTELVGFVYGFVGFEHGRVTIHSHLAAVRSEWRNRQIGYRLKLAQRDDALRRGIQEITWTFDPLQSLNAHFNFARLGVVTADYRVNFYGAEMTILVPGIGTDRFWVSWRLDSERVRKKIAGQERQSEFSDEFSTTLPLVEMNADSSPRLNEQISLTGAADAPAVTIAIPHNIAALQQASTELAIAWREKTRAAFTSAFSAGYTAVEFFDLRAQQPRHGKYLLRPCHRY
jgi:predicted GNAT superfamily acetyltransferase